MSSNLQVSIRMKINKSNWHLDSADKSADFIDLAKTENWRSSRVDRQCLAEISIFVLPSKDSNKYFYS